MKEAVIGPELEAYSPEVVTSPSGEALGVRFDVTSLLEQKVGSDWQERACDEILSGGNLVVKGIGHHTVREADPTARFGLITLGGEVLAERIPGIWELYRGVFKQMMQAALPPGLEPLDSYDDPRHGLEPVSPPVADPHSGVSYRYEAHVDERYTGVLVLDVPDASQGGQLVISNNPGAQTVEEIGESATYITHKPGTLFCFSQGRFYPHYTTEVTDPQSHRVTVSLNYPVEGESKEAAEALLSHNLGTSGTGGQDDRA